MLYIENWDGIRACCQSIYRNLTIPYANRKSFSWDRDWITKDWYIKMTTVKPFKRTLQQQQTNKRNKRTLLTWHRNKREKRMNNFLQWNRLIVYCIETQKNGYKFYNLQQQQKKTCINYFNIDSIVWYIFHSQSVFFDNSSRKFFFEPNSRNSQTWSQWTDTFPSNERLCSVFRFCSAFKHGLNRYHRSVGIILINFQQTECVFFQFMLQRW